MLRTFLVATRYGELPPGLGDVVRRIADLYRARLIVATVRPSSELAELQSGPSRGVATDRDAVPPKEREQSIVLVGEFTTAVCDKGHEADVIVIGRDSIPDTPDSSSSEELSNLVRLVPRPLWLFRRPTRYPEHILVAYDGSAHSGRALHLAANLAETVGARLTVLNVDESRDEVAQELVLSRAAGYCEPYEITMERVGLFGRAAESIDGYVRSSECDTLVVGAAGVGTLRGLLFGSVAGHLINSVPCSVLVAK